MMSPAQIAHGPMLIGTALNTLLYGITIIQTYLYYSSNCDAYFMQSFVCLFIADTVQTVFTIVYIYNSLILHFGDTEYLTTANLGFFIRYVLVFCLLELKVQAMPDPALTGIIGSLVQAFFAWRVKVLTRNMFAAGIILLCSVSSFLMGIATAVAIGIVSHFVEFQKFQVVVIIWLVSASFSDMVITTTLVIYLKRHRTGFTQTDTYIDRIIKLIVQTGLTTTTWAFVDLMVYLLNPTGLHLVFNFPLSKLYTNSLMSSLNARTFWQAGDVEDAMSYPTTFSLPTLKTNADPSMDRDCVQQKVQV